MQLNRRVRASIGAMALVACAAGPALTAWSDGSVAASAHYYKERSTRVIQPAVDVQTTAGEDGNLSGHIAVDAITSASVAAGADETAFTETRYEVGGGYAHTLGSWQLGASLRYSTEPDYRSFTAMTRVGRELLRKNVVLAAGLGVGLDHITNAGAQGFGIDPIAGDLSSYYATTSLSQVLSETAIASIGYDLTVLDGFQQNPYRTVITQTGLAAERHPTQRWRHAIYGQVRRYQPSLHATLIAQYRVYADSWGVLAHTPEARALWDISPRAQVSLRYRFYWQGAADFYEDRYATSNAMLEPYLTDDVKLSSFTTHSIGVGCDLAASLVGFRGKLGAWRGNLALTYIVQDNSFGNAIMIQAGATAPLGTTF